MKPAKLLGLVVSASLVLASTAAFAAPPEAAPAAPASPSTSQPGAPAPSPSSSPARASTDTAGEARPGDEEERGKAFLVAPLMGFGSNHFGFGLGARAGYTLPQNVYVGGTFMYHLGSSYGYGGLGGVDVSTHVLYPAGEVGYDFHVGPVTIRPYAGVGIAFLTASSTIAGQSASSTDSSLLIYPGATAHWNIPRSDFFVGGDTRIAVLTRGGDPSFGLYATAGLKF
jgi:hypothetical protein